MNPISLNLHTPTKAITLPLRDDKCPCGAGKDQRVNVGGFGSGLAVIVCQACGKELSLTRDR